MTFAMVKRETQQYDVPLVNRLALLHPESVVLRFGLSKTADVGQLCYMQRMIPTQSTSSGGRRVAIESLCRVRVKRVRRLISHISSVAESSGLRYDTLHSRFTRLIVFVSWADVNGWPDVLAGESNAIPAFRAYAAFVRDRVARNDLGLNAGAYQQVIVAQALGEFLDLEDFGRSLNLLKKDAKTAEVTVPPCETSQGKVLALCESLFDGFSRLVLEKHAYPYALKMPKYLNFPKDRLWIFPGKSWFKTPAMFSDSRTNAGYHFTDGRLASAEELKVEYSIERTKRRWQKVRWEARKCISAANADFNHRSRMHLAAQALNVYVIMFLAATGMNWAQAITLSWSDKDFEIEATKQGFRTIKWRAGGKFVSFELPIASLPNFKRFLALRRFLLHERACEHLFFKGRTAALAPQPFRSTLDTTYKLLRRLDPTLSNIMPREWRAAKSDWLVRNTDPATTALVLQNSEKTVLQSYTAGSEKVHHSEMGDFLAQVAGAVIARGQVLKNTIPRSVGVCISYGASTPVASTIPITPNCRDPEGCLFCDKFKVHADESDTRKLLSCRYCINLTAPANRTFEGFQEVLQPILDRIDQFVGEIAERDSEMVLRVTREVEEDGELDPYWASKVEMLMSLGI